MNRIPAYLGLAVASLICAAGAQAQPLPTENIASREVNYRDRLSSQKPNPYEKLSLDAGRDRPRAQLKAHQ